MRKLFKNSLWTIDLIALNSKPENRSISNIIDYGPECHTMTNQYKKETIFLLIIIDSKMWKMLLRI